MHVRCPHCQNPIELVDDASLSDVVCPSCGSSFSLIADETVSYPQGVHETIGHFELLERVGIGAFGAVWKARDTELDRTVAVKIPRQGQLDPTERDTFLREARAAAQFKHPGIVSVHEVGREDDTVYIVSDFVQGVPLSSRLSAGPTTVREAAELCAKIADALQHAHEAGVIHRDVKPSNIMLDDDGEPHVMDFGLAKRDAGEITMTADGKVLGTPAYMSPEQARGEAHAADARSDIYSLGAVLFQLLTGERPFRGDTRMLLHQVINDDPPSPRKLNSNVPRDLETICLKCLRKEPDRRYATAAAVADDLRRWMGGEPINARPVSRIEKAWLWCRRRPTVAGSIAAILLTGCVVTGFILLERQRNLEDRVYTTVASLNSNRGIIQPSFRELDSLPRDMVLTELREQVETADETRKLPLAFALAHFGDVWVGFLVSQVENASPDEMDNFASALGKSSAEAVSALADAARTAESQENWRHKTRLAVLALHLDSPTLARDMCQLRPDPVQRTWFIEECSTWHGDLSNLVQIVADSDDAPLRSTIVLAVGSAPHADVTISDKQVWEQVLLDWYRNEPDTLTHSATGWALRKWGLELPDIGESIQPIDDRNWHVNSVGMTMLEIPAGSFVRTDQLLGTESSGATGQTVTLSRSFLLADREVTREQFQQFIDDPDYENEERPDDHPGVLLEYSPTEQHPAQRVNWYDAVLFCNWLSRLEGLNACYERTEEYEQNPRTGDLNVLYVEVDGWRLIPDTNGYRLPTEAEWEYACRAGTVTTFSHGDEESLLDRYAVYRSSRTEFSGSKLPNGWGLFDVHGNVEEWCHDRYGRFGDSASLTDPKGPEQETERVAQRVFRGGSFSHVATFTASGNRIEFWPDRRSYLYGFRVARTYP